VAIWCGKHDGPAKVGFKIDDDGKKYRVCRKCGETL
jgi:large subunit ribosomal protein L24